MSAPTKPLRSAAMRYTPPEPARALGDSDVPLVNGSEPTTYFELQKGGQPYPYATGFKLATGK